MLLPTIAWVVFSVGWALLALALGTLIGLAVRQIRNAIKHRHPSAEWPFVLGAGAAIVAALACVAIGTNLWGGATASAINHDLTRAGYTIGSIDLTNSRATVLLGDTAQEVQLYQDGVPAVWRAYVACLVDPTGVVSTENCAAQPGK